MTVADALAGYVNTPFITQYFQNPLGLYALSTILILIILYLVKPKPKNMEIPSLMFILKDPKTSRTANFLRILFRDLLMFLQILILLLFAAALAKPYFEAYGFEKVDYAVIVLDASASMQAMTEGHSRFEQAMELSKKALGSKNTIILAADVPAIVAEDESKDEAKKTLSGLKPKDTITDLRSAINLASQSMEGKEGTIYVFSDFIDTKFGIDLAVKKRALEAVGQKIRYISFGGKSDNVGIINVEGQDKNFSVYLKNYDNEDKQIKLKVGNSEQSLLIKRYSTGVERFQSVPGVTKIEIATKDDFLTDNLAYFSTPEKTSYRTLLITNNPDESYIEKALASNPLIDLHKGVPPNNVPEIENYDLVIIKDVNPEFLLPGKIRQIKSKVSEGMGLIIFAQPRDGMKNIFTIDFQDMLPVYSTGFGSESEIISTKQQPLSDLSFGQTKKYYLINATRKVETFAEAEDGTPVIFRTFLGDGKIYYYGLFEDDANFHTQTDYPIFWAILVNDIVNRKDVSDLNKPTGTRLQFSEPVTVQLADGKKKKVDTVSMDKIGVYTFQDVSVVANLFSEKESSLEPAEKLFESIDNATLISSTKQRQDITRYVIYALLLFVFLELFYIKFRGDL